MNIFFLININCIISNDPLKTHQSRKNAPQIKKIDLISIFFQLHKSQTPFINSSNFPLNTLSPHNQKKNSSKKSSKPAQNVQLSKQITYTPDKISNVSPKRRE